MAGPENFIPEAERHTTAVADEAQLGENSLLNSIRDQWASRHDDERGMVSPVDFIPGAPVVKTAARAARRTRGTTGDRQPEAQRRPWVRRTVGVCAALGATAGLLTMCDATGKSYVDWRNAYVTANITDIENIHNTELSPGVTAFNEELDVYNVEWHMDSAHMEHIGPVPVKVPDVWPDALDPHVNRQLVGAGQEICGIPIAAALTQYDYSGKVYYKVDMSKLDCKISMSGGGPEYNPFTMHRGKINLLDPEGGREQLGRFGAAVAALLNGNLAQNLLNKQEAATRKDMTIAWLRAMGACNDPVTHPEFEAAEENELTTSLRELAANEHKSLGHVLFVRDTIPFHIDYGGLASRAVHDAKQAKPVFANVKPNKLTCAPPKEAATN